MDEEILIAKFRGLALSSLKKPKVEALLEAIMGLEKMEDLATLFYTAIH